MGQQAGEEWRRLHQRDAQRVVIDRFDADIFRFHGDELFAGYGGFQFRIGVEGFVAGFCVTRKRQAQRRVQLFVKIGLGLVFRVLAAG